MAAHRKLPYWADAILLPGLNLLAALFVSGLVIWALGESPLEVLSLLIDGAFGFEEGVGYTFYYATNFVFTGLAVSVAYHAGLFNIGGEGQAMLGGLGLTLAVFLVGDLSPVLAVFLAILGAAAFGGAWAFIPAYLQAKRGSHVVITTIMFNFIASALLAYLLVGPLQRPGGQMPESSDFPEGVSLMHLQDLFAMMGFTYESGPLNLSALIAVLCAVGVWFMLWRTRFGYELRVVGQNQNAARFAGISVTRMTVIAMMISGALAGMMGLNELLGEQLRLLGNFTLGYGFVGIAVAFMGRNHPVGIIIASIVFGALYQGGAEIGFEISTITKDAVVLIQGLVILFAGAMEHLFRDPVERAFRMVWERRAA
ncbi:ABC transporter permease [Kordiimonas lipolytica]|uniref:ABC transporter permease n=1 Tax=Kordiimonas lipolytica TaxID=1662421 RepID=A0ABV8U970_9PROT|nr:ABC transporter permease [Kordiimonas lipolytica]